MCTLIAFAALFKWFIYMFPIFICFDGVELSCSLEECEHLHRASVVDTNCVRSLDLLLFGILE